jgi:hypothetical protein
MNTSNILKIALIVGIAVILIYLIQKCGKNENFINDGEFEEEDAEIVEPFAEVAETEKPVAETQKDKTLAEGIAARKQLKAAELLPKDGDANAWAKVNPKGKGSLAFKNFIEAGYHLGINTVGQSLRNANLQIRSEPSNPQVPVSIWMNSTISPDSNRRDFEVGCKST